jgi:hypothetical protein
LSVNPGQRPGRQLIALDVKQSTFLGIFVTKDKL